MTFDTNMSRNMQESWLFFVPYPFNLCWKYPKLCIFLMSCCHDFTLHSRTVFLSCTLLFVLLLFSVTLYDCMPMASDCSACINTRIGTGFQCGWCDGSTCRVSEECDVGTSFVNTGAECPAPSIAMIQPQTGPPQGGTIITITGRNLGVTFSDFTANSITLTSGSNSVQCTPISEGYMSGREVWCRMNVVSVGTYTLAMDIPSGIGTYNDGRFVVSLPTVIDATPLQGPIAGGTRVTITGTNLDIGNNAVVGFAGITARCIVM